MHLLDMPFRIDSAEASGMPSGECIGKAELEGRGKEIMQEIFLTLHEKAASFRGDTAVSTWLYRLTANAAIRAADG